MQQIINYYSSTFFDLTAFLVIDLINEICGLLLKTNLIKTDKINAQLLAHFSEEIRPQFTMVMGKKGKKLKVVSEIEEITSMTLSW